jgi:hypothetical protein
MNKRITWVSTPDVLTIHINQTQKSIVTILLILGGIGIIVLPIYYILDLLKNATNNSVLLILPIAIYLIVMFYVGKNILTRALFQERLEISKSTLSIIIENGFKANRKDYDINIIKNLRYAGYQTWTSHPVGDANVDFTGIAAREKMVSAINASGNIEFEYYDHKIAFGNNVPSWDAEIIFKQIKNFIGDNIDIVEDTHLEEPEQPVSDANI